MMMDFSWTVAKGGVPSGVYEPGAAIISPAL